MVALFTLALLLALGLRNYADMLSVFCTALAEYALVACMLWLVGRWSGKPAAAGDIRKIVIKAELPTLIFPALAIMGVPPYVISEAGVLTVALGGIVVFSQPIWDVRRRIAAGVGFVLLSCGLSAYMVRAPEIENAVIAEAGNTFDGPSYDVACNSFRKAPFKKLLKAELRPIKRDSREFAVLRMVLEDSLNSYYNAVPSELGHYAVHRKLLRYRMADDAAKKWDSMEYKAAFSISAIEAAEEPGAVEFRISGRRRMLPMGETPRRALESEFDISANVYNALDDRGRAGWTLYYVRSNE